MAAQGNIQLSELIKEEELQEESVSLLKNDQSSVNPESTLSLASLISVPSEKQIEKRAKAKQDNSIRAWMCRMWFIIGLLTVWPIAYAISMPIYFLHKYIGFDAKKTWLGKIFRTATAMVIKSNPYWKLSVTHTNKKSLPSQEKKCIFVCNHQSNMDPFALICGALPIETKWVSKSDLFSIPFAGRMMKNAGDVPIVFKSKKMDDMSTDRDSVKSAMNSLKEHLRNDCAVFFFPEGRRSSTPDQLSEWKKGASIMSLETGADIIPIGLYGTFTMWGLEEALPTPGKTAIVVGEPISVKGMTLEKDIETLNEITREAVAELLQKAMAQYAKM